MLVPRAGRNIDYERWMRAKLREGQALGRVRAVARPVESKPAETALPRASRSTTMPAAEADTNADAPVRRSVPELAEVAAHARRSFARTNSFLPPAAEPEQPAAIHPQLAPATRTEHVDVTEPRPYAASERSKPTARTELPLTKPKQWCVPELRACGTVARMTGASVLEQHLALALALAKRDLARKLRSGVPLEQLAPPQPARVQPAVAPMDEHEAQEQQAAVSRATAQAAKSSRVVAKQQHVVLAMPQHVLPPRSQLVPKTPARVPAVAQASRRRAAAVEDDIVSQAPSDVAAELWRLSGMRDPEEMTAVIERLAKQHVELELGIRDGYDTTEITTTSQDIAMPPPLPPPRVSYLAASRRSAAAVPAPTRTAGGWDDSPVQPPPIGVLRSRRDFLQWPQTKRGGLPMPDGPLPWKAPPAKRRPYGTAQSSTAGKSKGQQVRRGAVRLPPVSEHPLDAADAAMWDADETRLQQLTARTAALVEELRTMERQASTGVPSTPVTRSAPSAAPAPEPRIAMPLSPRTAAELLAEVRAAEAEARVLRARWGLDAVAVDSSSRLRLRDTGQERRRAAKSSTGSSSYGLTATRKSRITIRTAAKPPPPVPVSAPLVERVLAGRQAFEAHKQGAHGHTLPADVTVVEAVAERLMADELRALAAHIAAEEGAGLEAVPEADEEDEAQWLVASPPEPEAPEQELHA